MASAMPHGMLKAAAGRVSMPPSRPRCTIIGDRCPRNRDQDSDTAQDQQVAHTASSRDSQASSPFLFDQATGLPCKFNLNLESEMPKGVRHEWHSEIRKLPVELGIDRCRPPWVKDW